MLSVRALSIVGAVASFAIGDSSSPVTSLSSAHSSVAGEGIPSSGSGRTMLFPSSGKGPQSLTRSPSALLMPIALSGPVLMRLSAGWDEG